MTSMHRHQTILPLPLPEDDMQRFVLFAVRRMAVYGIRDAHAAARFVGLFGLRFRKPLVLMRAFIVELAQASTGTITIAPCCAPRMTRDEALIVGILATAASNPDNASKHLMTLTASPHAPSALATAAAFNDAAAELGRPIVI